MKKILYITNHKFSLKDGVAQKIKNQVNYWENDFEIKLLSNTHKSKLIKYILITINDLFDLFKSDLIYIRFAPLTLRNFLFTFHPRSIIEINSDLHSEFYNSYKISGSLIDLVKYFFNKYSFIFYKKFASAFIFVTFELEKKYSTKIKSIVLPNTFNGSTKKFSNSTKNQFFFITNENAYWQGLDYIEGLAKIMQEYTFVVVGVNKEDKGNVLYLGHKEYKDYKNYLFDSVMCFGTLALHRKGMNEACPLKVREYVMHSKPIVAGCLDTSILMSNKTPNWYLHLNDFKDLHIVRDKIINFLSTDFIYDGDEYFLSEIIEKKRIDFFKSLLVN